MFWAKFKWKPPINSRILILLKLISGALGVSCICLEFFSNLLVENLLLLGLHSFIQYVPCRNRSKNYYGQYIPLV